ncbi:MAG: MBL fold metallo-hydrolase [Chloroflexi bacterium]|nr:MBL fold metallo-hydrolase [Chloroflexota bacterium]
MTEVTRIKLSLSNAYILRGRKTILLDSGSPREGVKILRALARMGIEPKDFSLILHTHAHFDHAGSTLELKRWINVPTAVHAADAAMLARGRTNLLTATRPEGGLIKLLLGNKTFSGFKADFVIQDDMSLKDFGVDGKIIFTPGHTAGSLSVLLNDGQAMIGDLLMGGSLGGNLFAARPNYHYFAESMDDVRASIKKLMGFKPKRLYVGHGGPLTPEAVIERFSRDIQFQRR